MVFSSILFLFRFMPAAFAVYYLVPRRFKNFTLLVLSLIFYSWGEAKYFPIMIASILVDYTASGLIESHRDNKLICRLALIFSMVFNLGMLGFFKYTNFFVGNLNALFGWNLPGIRFVLPLGISFYTFQTMSYTIDVYLGKVKAERNLIDFGAFVVLSPATDRLAPLCGIPTSTTSSRSGRSTCPRFRMASSTSFWAWAARCSSPTMWAPSGPRSVGGPDGLPVRSPHRWPGWPSSPSRCRSTLTSPATRLMAIGLGRMLGFDFPKNFDFPLCISAASPSSGAAGI